MSASSIPLEGNGFDGTKYADAPPKAMTVQDIEEVTQEFAAAAKRALEAGFDGVEIHG
jgi:2,4-dienoyl-CoA reductase-like NADH-dependent reductase (Old Yellow Enzyme family)